MVTKPKTHLYIRLLSSNANGVQSKMHEPQELLQRERIDMCAINEMSPLPNVAFILCNFVTYRQDRTDACGRGVTVLVKRSIQHHSLSLPVL
jgi:hypothetical protein